MEGNKFPKRVFYMNVETTRPRNRSQTEVREDGRIFGGEEWQEKVYNKSHLILLDFITRTVVGEEYRS
jgi:hypothetical protein